MKKIVECDSPERTARLAFELAQTLRGGEVILARGDLGTGKTHFAKALAKALGVKGTVNSPTFNLIKVYQGQKWTFYHVDCYRLEGVEERLKDLGFEDFLGEKDVITYVEWPEDGPSLLEQRKDAIRLSFAFVDEEKRRIEIDDPRE